MYYMFDVAFFKHFFSIGVGGTETILLTFVMPRNEASTREYVCGTLALSCRGKRHPHTSMFEGYSLLSCRGTRHLHAQLFA